MQTLPDGAPAAAEDPVTPSGGDGAPPAPLSPGGDRAPSHYSGITGVEQERLRELRSELNTAAAADPTLLGTAALRRFANDATLCRYLRARQWNLAKAMKMLVASLQWRATSKPEDITWADIAQEAGQPGPGIMTLCCFT